MELETADRYTPSHAGFDCSPTSLAAQCGACSSAPHHCTARLVTVLASTPTRTPTTITTPARLITSRISK